MPGIRKDRWTEDEDMLLLQVFRSPNLLKLWNQKAKQNGWKTRSRAALKRHILDLGESMRYADESQGWLTAFQLQGFMGVANTCTIHRWIGLGLPAYRDGDKPCSLIKIHLHDFVRWAISPPGAEAVAPFIKDDQLVSLWLLRQIGDWVDEKPIRIQGGERRASKRSRGEYADAV